MSRCLRSRMVLLMMLLCGSDAWCDDDAAPQAAARTDLYGDLLPEGALARLGTVRYRACAGSGRIEFLADGQTLLGCNHGHVLWLDAPTGRIVLDVNLDSENTTLLAVTRDRSLAAVGTYQFLKADHDEQFGVTFIDTASGEVRSRIQYRGSDNRKNITAACFTPDAARLITGDNDGVLRVWTVATGHEEMAQALPTPDQVYGIDVSADGTWLAATNMRTACRWAWQSGADLQQFGPSDEWVLCVSCVPQSDIAALWSDTHGSFRLFDLETGHRAGLLSAPGHRSVGSQPAFTSDGAQFAAPAKQAGELDVWNVKTTELSRSFRGRDNYDRVTISPDDRLIAAANYEGTVAVWEFASGTPIGGEFFGHRETFGTLAVSSDGSTVATGGNDGQAVLWDPETGFARHHLAHDPDTLVRGLAFSLDGRYVATSAFDDTVVIWDAQSGKRVHTLVGHGELGGRRVVQFTPDGRRLLSFGDDWFLRAFNVRTGKAELEHALRPSGLKLKEKSDGTVDRDDEMFGSLPSAGFTPDGKTMLLVTRTDGYVFDVETGMERRRYELGAIDDNLALSPDGTRLATLRLGGGVETPLLGGGVRSESSRVYAVDIRNALTGDVEHTLQIPTEFSPVIAFSPDGSRLALSATIVHVYDIATGRELARIEPPVRAAWGVSFMPDGRRLVATHADCTAIVWDWEHFRLPEEAKP